MKTVELTSKIIVYEDRSEVPTELMTLIAQAEEAARRAYAPYSRFQVGAIGVSFSCLKSSLKRQKYKKILRNGGNKFLTLFGIYCIFLYICTLKKITSCYFS